MTQVSIANLDDFCSGHMVVNQDRNILFCNDYLNKLSGLPRNKLINTPIANCFTKASNIFIDSYVFPILLNEKLVQEIQLNWIGLDGVAISVVANIRLVEDGRSFWSMTSCTNRDKLYSELIQTKNKLEEQSQELFLMATTDPLTGLLNRRELLVQADRLSHLVARYSSTYALLTIDVDFFKHVNDTYGHQAGDKVLVNLANILTEGRRTNDLIARVGGEEFVMVLPHMDEKNAFIFAEKLRKKVQSQSVDNLHITVSIGLVVSQKDINKQFDLLLNLSDKALYDAKNSGRNKTAVATH
ncbi:sensor domain-containing diguanylate cyclase [Paraglaciecola sp. L3A3]|uniref:sensor domain-containing diguanylate cyclase n=1 Tax=Paraglaciecola sp. L3A3 TaxID=2686358 RepID=UPI00131B431F|nr:sensor domain-containing diguanylate cyclase [Paraglaciecola sp. L3A3]